jgi:hypothetical protein
MTRNAFRLFTTNRALRLAAAASFLLLIGCASKPAAEAPKQADVVRKPRILLFYPSASVAALGEQVLICYGVEDASAVKIDPAIEQLTPSFNRCFQYAPSKTATYTLTATGKDGSSVTQAFEIKVQGIARQKTSDSVIATFVATSNDVPAGSPVALCFDASGAQRIRVEPDQQLPADKKGCFIVRPAKTTDYTLIATTRAGGEERRRVTVRVK